MSQLSLRLHQLARALDQRFTYTVPQVGIKDGDTEKAKDDALRHRRSRGLAALAATLLAGVSDAVAAERVTDRGEDDGIDGFARIPPTADSGPVLYLVQSKWSAGGNHNLGTDDIRTLVDGLGKLQTWEALHPANPIRNFRSEVWDNGIKVPGVKLVLVWATSGENQPADGVQKYAKQKIKELTDEGVKVEGKFLLLGDFSDALLRSVAPTGVTVSGIMLSSHKVDEQKHSLQGAISAVDLGVWYQRHGVRLLDDNIRFPRRSRVNEEIRRTLLEEPDVFWALHGDVIAVCDTWQQSAVRGRNVPYTFHDLRIVNGAQTSAILGEALRAAQEKGPAALARLAKAEVPIRFLKLSGRPPGFGAQAAFTHNRINPVTPRDRLAMQHVQQRLRDDFTLSWGEAYLVRADERPPEGVTSYSVLEGALSMACARLAVPALTEAKDDVEALWPGDRDLYDLLFSARPRDRTNAAEVRRRIIALRAINAALHADGTCRTEREKEVAVLGDFLIAHVVFQRLGSDGIEDVASGWDRRLKSVPGHVRVALRSLAAAVTGRLAERGAPEPGKGFRRVSGVLQDDEWLAGAVRRVVRADETAEPADAAPGAAWRSEPEFRLPIRGGALAQGRRCDGGFLVYAGSTAALDEWPSLTTPQRRHRRNLRGTLGLAPVEGGLRLTRDALFESPSQAAAVMVGHSANGADEWAAPDGRSYNQVVRDEAASSS